MSAISDMLSSAFSELIYEKKEDGQKGGRKEEPQQKDDFGKENVETIRETIDEPGSLAEFDRVLGMLESKDQKTVSRAISSLGRMTDESRLALIAIFSRNPEGRKAAVARIKGNPSLLEMVFSESLSRETSAEALDILASMLDSLDDRKALCALVCNHRDRRVRMRALGMVKDVRWLIDIAYGSKFEDSRWEAIERLKDRKVDIDREDLRQDDTLGLLADQLVKSSISEEEVVEYMGIMLENVRYLEGITRARSDEFGDIVRDNLSAYQRILKEIATFSRHRQAREMALKGMEDDTPLLAEIAQHSEYEDTAERSVEMLSLSGKAEPQALALVAALSSDTERRAKAVAKLQNAQMLKHVIKFSRYEDSRISAAHRLASMVDSLEDAESLRLVVAYAKESKNRERAERRIRELGAGKKKPAPDLEAAKPLSSVVIETPGPEDEKQVAEAAVPSTYKKPEHQAEPHPNGGGLWGMLRDLIGF